MEEGGGGNGGWSSAKVKGGEEGEGLGVALTSQGAADGIARALRRGCSRLPLRGFSCGALWGEEEGGGKGDGR